MGKNWFLWVSIASNLHRRCTREGGKGNLCGRSGWKTTKDLIITLKDGILRVNKGNYHNAKLQDGSLEIKKS